jgi:prepilin-type N-terminal cleavage/methylation domain-containing protein
MQSGRGLTLIEVVIAMALLAVSLVAVAGLFASGGRSLAGGGHLTQATAIATSILEETEALSFDGLLAAVGAGPSQSLATADSAVHPWAARFQPEIAARLGDGHAVVTLAAFEPSGASTFAAARAVRVGVVIEWMEGGRPRRAELQTVRF